MINEANTVYEIRYDFDLNGATLTIKSGCILDFKGGKLLNGTINVNKSSVLINPILENVSYQSDFLAIVNVNQYGIFGDNISDCSDKLNSLIGLWDNPLFYFPNGKYVFSKPIILSKNVSFVGEKTSYLNNCTTFIFNELSDDECAINSEGCWETPSFENIYFKSDRYILEENRKAFYTQESYKESEVWTETINSRNICIKGNSQINNCKIEGFYLGLSELGYSYLENVEFISCGVCVKVNSDNIINNIRCYKCNKFVENCFSLNTFNNIRLDSIKDVAFNIQGNYNHFNGINVDYLYKSVFSFFNNCKFNYVVLNVGRSCMSSLYDISKSS